MNFYTLENEQKLIDHLINLLANKLNKKEEDLQNIKEKFTTIISRTRDVSIEEILNVVFELFSNELSELLTFKIAPAFQIGIQTESFKLITYAGKQNGTKNACDIDENTYFSFDSISKLITSTITMQEIRNTSLTLETKLHDFQPEFALNSKIEEILKFTSNVQTEKRLENLSLEETIAILKRTKENLEEKQLQKNFYLYNDIGYMILRLSIPNFLEKLNTLLSYIDSINLTYKTNSTQKNITGGRINEEYITPDQKGRTIPFPGHTGLYGNIQGLLNLMTKIFYTESILSKEEQTLLLKQPYPDPRVYSKDGTPLPGKNNTYKYMAKIAGIYRKPTGILEDAYNKLSSCDMSNLTTDNAKSSAGTCGTWCIVDNLSIQNRFSNYSGGILTNPYSYIHKTSYPEEENIIPSTDLIVNKKGKINNYSTKLNTYKELITEYALILELVTEYIKEVDKQILTKKQYKLTKKIEELPN